MIIDDNTPIFVLAGDMAQAGSWIRRHVRYVRSSEILRGHENPVLVRVGTWYKRKDSDDIMDIVMSQTRNSQESKESVDSTQQLKAEIADEICEILDKFAVLGRDSIKDRLAEVTRKLRAV